MISLVEIENILRKFHATDKHEIQYAIRFFVPTLNQYLYLNKEAGEKASALVIHPRYESYWNLLADIPGVQSTNYLNHKSAYREFPQRMHTGRTPMPFGIPFGFDSTKSLEEFLDILSKLPRTYIRKADSEVKDAKESGEFTELSSTETERLVKSRVGQGKFRDGVIDLWESCSVTECKELTLLKASHIKPWRDASNAERLDPFNGLLLTPNLDTAFDSGYITFDNDGVIVVSSHLTKEVAEALSISSTYKLRFIASKTEKYLRYHRRYIFIP